MSLRNIIKAALVFTLSVVLIVVIGLVGMLSFTAVTFFQDREDTASMVDINAALVERDSAYIFETPALLKDNHRWAMLISADGNILWSQDLPKDVPLHYELADVASFTRWYLEDYPVTTRIRDDGILVVGAPKGSQWKQLIVFSMQNLSVMPYWFVSCVCFMLIAVLGTSALLLRHWFHKDQERRDAARANWIHGISHDIRTPLALVMGKAGQLENDPRLPVDARKDATIICNQSQTIRDLVGDLNLTMRLDCAMQPLRLELLQPEAVVRQAAADFLNSGLADGYPFEIDLPDTSMATINADAVLLRRALTNLLNNCVRHNPVGAAIHMASCERGKDCVFIVESEAPASVATATGGITPDGNAAHGTGLKLVAQIAQAHGGYARFIAGDSFRCEIVLPK